MRLHQASAVLSFLAIPLIVGWGLAQAAPSEVDWFAVDHGAKKVTLKIVAGEKPENNHWNFNGKVNGELTIVVPVDYAVELTFVNKDPYMAHSIGVGELPGSAYPALFDNPVPVFEAALSASATDMAGATQPGASEVLTFRATKAGEYALICYIPGHASTGMWVRFTVSADGEAGVR